MLSTKYCAQASFFFQVFTTATYLKERIRCPLTQGASYGGLQLLIIDDNSPNVRRRPMLRCRVSSAMLSTPTHIALLHLVPATTFPTPTHATYLSNHRHIAGSLTKADRYKYEPCIKWLRHKITGAIIVDQVKFTQCISSRQ